MLGERGVWASTVAWGRNAEPHGSSSALLLESNLTRDDRDAWFGRLVIAGKTAHDLDIPGEGLFTVSKLQGGYTRYLDSWKGLKPGIGLSVSTGFVPEALQTAYGSHANGIGIFVTLRPAVMVHAVSSATQSSAPRMVMVQTAMDPAKLACAPQIDPKAAPSTTYKDKTYYFCSVKERDEFLTNPEMSLSMRPPKQ
jgi:YHS domain-containing protein